MENIKQAIKLLKEVYNTPKTSENVFFRKPKIKKSKSRYLLKLNNKPINDEIMEKAIKSEATDDDIERLNRLEIEIEELKEKLKENYDINIEKNLEDKENELKDLIDENENNIVELKELIDRTNKLEFYVPAENNDKNNEEEEEENKNEYKNKLIFDGKNVILQDNDNNEIEKVSYTKFGKEMFFEILEDIYINGEESMFLIKNYNNLSIADIILKHCRILNQNNEKIISLDDIVSYCANKNIDPTKENFVKIFCEIGDVEVIKYCISNKAKLNEIEKINELAYNGNNYELIHILEDIGIEPNFDCLSSACAASNLDLINYLLNNNEYDKDDLIGLFSIIKDPRVADLILKELLAKGFDINTGGIFSKNKTIMKAPLHLAVENNCIEIVQYLLNEKLTGQKIDINKQIGKKSYIAQKDFNNSETALNCAIKNENKEIVKLLLGCTDIDVNLKNTLYYAVQTENIEIIKLLIKHPKIDINLTFYNEKPFYLAIYNDNSEIIDLFLKHPDIDLNEKYINIRGNFIETTLFCLAVINGNMKLAKILLSQPNTDINAKYSGKMHGGSHEMAPLHFAIDNDNVEMVKFLLSQPNIDVNTKFITYNYGNNSYKDSIREETPILYYIMNHDRASTINPEILKLLLFHPNIDINAKYIKYYENGNKEYEETTLYRATKLSNNKEYEEKLKAYEIFKLLVSHPNLDINAESVKYDENGNIENKKMLFYEAIKAGNIEAANFLLPYNKDIDINKKYEYFPFKYRSYKFEETLLHIAIKSYTVEVVDFLLTNYPDIDINAEYVKYDGYYNDGGRVKETPVTMAIYQRSKEISELLLKNANIDVNIERVGYYENGNIREKETPIYMAIFYGDKKLVELLLKNPNLDLDKKYIKYNKDGNIEEEETILYSAARGLWYEKEIFELIVNEKIRRIEEKRDNIERMEEEIIKQKNELNELKKNKNLNNILDEIKKYEEKLDNIENEISFKLV